MVSETQELRDEITAVVMRNIKENIDDLVFQFVNESLARHLETMIETAKNEASKQMASKLLELFIKEGALK